MRISGSDKKVLLTLAARAITGKIAPELLLTTEQSVLSENLQYKCGAFVSVYVDGKLRGCIGTFSEEYPLYKNVENMAVSAASDDSRFKAIHTEELARIQLEISVLTPRQRINDPSEIILGKHGIYMKLGSNRGTLLPQVALNQKWTVGEFLGNCSKYKAGIGWDGWKAADLYTYEAIVFKADTPAS